MPIVYIVGRSFSRQFLPWTHCMCLKAFCHWLTWIYLLQIHTFVSVNVGSFLQPFLVSPKLFPSLNDNPNSRCETSEKLENKQFAGFEKIIFMWKPLGEMSKLTPTFSFSASIFMSDARIFGSKFVLLQILKYHQMIQYYNGIHPNLSTFNITKYY